jgi:hypothetical protein
VVSIISSRVMSGRMVGRRFAIMDLPAPGGPTIRMLCPPAAATSRARFTFSWPLTSAKSRPLGTAVDISPGAAGSMSSSPRKYASSWATVFTGYTVTFSAKAASAALPYGTKRRRIPAPGAASAMGSAPGTSRTSPVRDSSPKKGAVRLWLLYVPGGGQNTQQNRQVVDRAGFFGVSGRQIHRHAADGEFEAVVFYGGAHALAGLPDRRVRQSHHVEARKSVGDEALHRHLVAAYSLDAKGTDF